MSGRETILVLVDELRPVGLAKRSRALIDGLGRHVDVVIVAQCYLKPWHRARRLGLTSELYGFAAENYTAQVAAFAAAIAARHRPGWVVAYGWENAQLVVALDRLDLPVISFIDDVSVAPNAESQINRTFRHATDILFSDEAIPQSLTIARWGLESRAYKVLSQDRRFTPTGRAAAKPWYARALRRQVGEPPDDVAQAVEALLDIGREAARRRATTLRQAALDAALIEATGGLNTDLAVGRKDDPGNAMALYLRASELTVPRDRTFAGRLLRRPIAGFHPLIYASDHPGFDEASGEDPLAHFIRGGRPQGRWTHDIVGPKADATRAGGIRAVIHAHLHYTDLLPELVERFGNNRSSLDLIVTTTSSDRRSDIEATLAEAGIAARSIIVCENVGRDLWPFIELLRSDALSPYDVVCHVHGKRSPHYDLGHIWRDFLWTHLIGDADVAMADSVLGRFASEPKLGLVFAEEPHLEGWEQNLTLATELAARAGIPLPLPNHFEYPMGTMFWARPAALAPLLRLGLTRGDIPDEPLAVDGTILHALERLIPFFVALAGFGYATTHVPGSVR